MLSVEASERLVGSPVFKTGVRADPRRRVRFPSASAKGMVVLAASQQRERSSLQGSDALPTPYPRYVAYRSVTHVAIRVRGLREAERYYGRLFGLEVAFREAETVDGWRTLPEDAGWEDAEAAGISLSMCVLTRDAFRLALEEDPKVESHGVLDHVGLLVEPKDLEALRARAGELDAMIALERETLLILHDRYGVRWEITTRVREDPRAESSGATRGLWLDLTPRDHPLRDGPPP
jgi:catechol 2,3-dioxygenase-like lactoylglutathione lyase family enzyme